MSHFVDGDAHGPVRLFVADDGRAVLVCDIDGACWQLPDLSVEAASQQPGGALTAEPSMAPSGKETMSIVRDWLS
jgi:hypothetical protein